MKNDSPTLERRPPAARSRARKRAMPAKAVKDRATLIMHRLIARRLRFDPAMLEQARRLISGPPDFSLAFQDEWREILSRPDAEVMAFMATRGDWPMLMRTDSPFLRVEAFAATGLLDHEIRLRVWRKAKLAEG